MTSVLPKWLRFDSQQLEAHCTLHHVHITLIQGFYGNHLLIPFFRRKISSPPTSTSSWSPKCVGPYCHTSALLLWCFGTGTIFLQFPQYSNNEGVDMLNIRNMTLVTLMVTHVNNCIYIHAKTEKLHWCVLHKFWQDRWITK